MKKLSVLLFALAFAVPPLAFGEPLALSSTDPVFVDDLVLKDGRVLVDRRPVGEGAALDVVPVESVVMDDVPVGTRGNWVKVALVLSALLSITSACLASSSSLRPRASGRLNART